MMKFTPGGRLRLIGAGVLVTTFLAGGLAGAAFRQSQLAASDAAPAVRAGERRGDRDGRTDNRDGDRRRSSIYDQLTLSADQDSMIDAIFARSGREADRVWRHEFRPIVDSLLNEARAEVREILTPEQTEHLDSLLAMRRRRAAEARSNNQPRQGPDQPGSRNGGGRPDGQRKPNP